MINSCNCICDELMQRLQLNGVVNAEFFRTETGYKIIEVNPRFSAGTSFSCMAGCNTVMSALRIAQKKDCSLRKLFLVNILLRNMKHTV